MTPLDLLRRVRERLSVPERWTKGVFARNHKGEPVPPDSPHAVCWCVNGAVQSLSIDFQLRDDVFRALLGIKSIERRTHVLLVNDAQVFNDARETTHAILLARLDAAIARLEAA